MLLSCALYSLYSNSSLSFRSRLVILERWLPFRTADRGKAPGQNYLARAQVNVI